MSLQGQKTISKEKTTIELPPELAEISKLTARLENPLAGLSIRELEAAAIDFCENHGLQDQSQFLF